MGGNLLPTKIINILLDLDDDPTFAPSSARVVREQKVQWQSTVGPFSVQFVTTPFDQVIFYSQPPSGGVHQTIAVPVQAGAAITTYHYAAAVTKETKVVLDAGCPEIIVTGSS
ncbi:MAG: hypothetical protein ACRD96_17900 [Bryobacteraceae bacterium]